jgi:DNA-binding GntR family transcriptional regulator
MPDTVSTIDTDNSLESPTLASRTFDSIKTDIIEGELAQGTKIVESDLALKYGISRGPLREAIHRLEQIKLIVRVPHAGSRVITLDSKMMEWRRGLPQD